MEVSIWLIVGVGAVAFAIGYMTGGSKSPVLGGVLTGVFALVTLASGVMTNSDLGKKLDAMTSTMSSSNTTIQTKIVDLRADLAKSPAATPGSDLVKKADEIKAAIETTNTANTGLQKSLDSIKADLEKTPLYVGATLLVFAICFMGGSFVGTKARADEWFRPKRTLPWSDGSAPGKTTEAITWLALQEKLLGFGYTKSQIQGLYRKWKDTPSHDTESDIIQALAQLSGQSIDVPPYNLM